MRTFRTLTDGPIGGLVHALWDQEVRHESTGVYWVPIFEILEQRGFEVIVVNARDAKHVPGRKTDVIFASESGCWIALRRWRG